LLWAARWGEPQQQNAPNQDARGQEDCVLKAEENLVYCGQYSPRSDQMNASCQLPIRVQYSSQPRQDRQKSSTELNCISVIGFGPEFMGDPFMAAITDQPSVGGRE